VGLESRVGEFVMRARNALIAACLPLAFVVACNQAPVGKGEVLARVYGEKVTSDELDAELKAAEAPNANDPNVRKEALQRVVLRKVLAHAAHEKKLDKDPDYPFLKQAAIESFEASLVQRSALKASTAPTLQEASAFVAEHPEMFAQRTVYLVEELQVNQPPDPALFQVLKPLNDLPAIEKVLQERRVPYRRGADQLDSLRVDPKLSLQVARDPGSAFVVPGPNGGYIIARVRDSKVQPVVGEPATSYASALLTAQRKQKAVNDAVQSAMTAAKSNIVYSDGYGPPEEKPAAK
jgi:EpsD family peptidyl-prolyl cis-trans isomerase